MKDWMNNQKSIKTKNRDQQITKSHEHFRAYSKLEQPTHTREIF